MDFCCLPKYDPAFDATLPVVNIITPTIKTVNMVRGIFSIIILINTLTIVTAELTSCGID